MQCNLETGRIKFAFMSIYEMFVVRYSVIHKHFQKACDFIFAELMFLCFLSGLYADASRKAFET